MMMMMIVIMILRGTILRFPFNSLCCTVNPDTCSLGNGDISQFSHMMKRHNSDFSLV